jgi:hypothetical protein
MLRLNQMCACKARSITVTACTTGWSTQAHRGAYCSSGELDLYASVPIQKSL